MKATNADRPMVIEKKRERNSDVTHADILDFLTHISRDREEAGGGLGGI